MKNKTKRVHTNVLFLKSLNFVWYYPRKIGGAVCTELFPLPALKNFLEQLNR